MSLCVVPATTDTSPPLHTGSSPVHTRGGRMCWITDEKDLNTTQEEQICFDPYRCYASDGFNQTESGKKVYLGMFAFSYGHSAARFILRLIADLEGKVRYERLFVRVTSVLTTKKQCTGKLKGSSTLHVPGYYFSRCMWTLKVGIKWQKMIHMLSKFSINLNGIVEEGH